MITVTYNQPAPGDTRLEGVYFINGVESGTWSTPLLETVEATEAYIVEFLELQQQLSNV
jgi:hypothetical protein